MKLTLANILYECDVLGSRRYAGVASSKESEPDIKEKGSGFSRPILIVVLVCVGTYPNYVFSNQSKIFGFPFFVSIITCAAALLLVSHRARHPLYSRTYLFTYCRYHL